MATRERDYDESQVSPDPELLYTKEYCIGLSHIPQCCLCRVLTDCYFRRWQLWQGLQRVRAPAPLQYAVCST